MYNAKILKTVKLARDFKTFEPLQTPRLFRKGDFLEDVHIDFVKLMTDLEQFEVFVITDHEDDGTDGAEDETPTGDNDSNDDDSTEDETDDLKDGTDGAEDETNLEDLTVDQLKEQLTAKGVDTFTSKTLKPELIELLKSTTSEEE